MKQHAGAASGRIRQGSLRWMRQCIRRATLQLSLANWATDIDPFESYNQPCLAGCNCSLRSAVNNLMTNKHQGSLCTRCSPGSSICFSLVRLSTPPQVPPLQSFNLTMPLGIPLPTRPLDRSHQMRPHDRSTRPPHPQFPFQHIPVQPNQNKPAHPGSRTPYRHALGHTTTLYMGPAENLYVVVHRAHSRVHGRLHRLAMPIGNTVKAKSGS